MRTPGVTSNTYGSTSTQILCVLFREENSFFQFQVRNLSVHVDKRKLAMTTHIFEHTSLYVVYYYYHHHHHYHQSFKM